MNDSRSHQDPSQRSLLNKLSQMLSSEPQDREELLAILRDAQHRAILDVEALGIIEGALQVSEMKVREIMIPRSQMVAVKAGAEPREFLPNVTESAHSRFPVIGDNIDDVIGILLAKDLIPLLADGTLDRANVRKIICPATFVPESKRLNVLLKEFRATRNHMAIVINEYGGTAGLVTIEDVLEQIVGEIEDEHDLEDENLIKESSEDEFVVKALTPVEDFNEYFQTAFASDEFDTIGGLILQQFGHLPKRGESVTFGDFVFKVLHANSRSVHLLQVNYR